MRLENEVLKKLAEAEGMVAKIPPFDFSIDTAVEFSDYWYYRGQKDMCEWILPHLAKQRKVKEWLKDWTLSAPLDDIEAFCNGDVKLE